MHLSYVLNRGGMRIPRIANRAISGADGSWYSARVRDLGAWLQSRFGEPEVGSLPAHVSSLNQHRGLLIFDVPSWFDSGGHATLWNGAMGADPCDFSETRDALLWTLH